MDQDEIKSLIIRADEAGDEEAVRVLLSKLDEGEEFKPAKPIPPRPDASYGESALTMGSAIVAEPVAGLAGLAQSLNPFADEGAGAQTVEDVRSAMTYTPRTAEGLQGLSNIADTLAPAGDAFAATENYLGDNVMEMTGSPVLAAAAKTMPTLMLELLGLKSVQTVAKGTKKAKRLTGALSESNETLKALSEAAPSIDDLKNTSKAVYQELDGLGVRVAADEFENLSSSILNKVQKEGLDPTLHPKTTAAVNRLLTKSGEDVSLTELDTLRKVASGALDGEPADQRLAYMVLDSIDDFMEDPKGFVKPPEVDVGKRYKVARELWGRARRAEVLEDAFEKARNQASGFENGIVTQFRSLLNNKRTKKMFKGDELKAMQRVVRGSTSENLLKLIGRMGLFEGKSTSLLGGAIGGGIGFAAAGPAGAVALPLIGQVSRQLAQRLTVKNANFANEIIRAGRDGQKIVQSYIKNTPKAQRNPVELSQLLMAPDIDLNAIRFPIGKEAASVVRLKTGEYLNNYLDEILVAAD